MNHVAHTFKPLSLLSLCTGLRALERGIARAVATLRGSSESDQWREEDILKPAAYVEIESIAAYNLVAQMEQRVLAPAPVWTDLKTFPWHAFHGKIHVLTGGYPCQPFSQAGLQQGILDPRHLYPYIEHGVDAVRPVCCFFENVANHLNLGYREVKHSLESLGYAVKEGIFSAQEVGAPHIRKRLFILAVANAYSGESREGRRNFAEMFGIPQGQRQPKHCASLSGRDCAIVDNTHGQRKLQSQGIVQSIGGRLDDPSEGVGLANSFSAGLEEWQKQSTQQKRSTTQRGSDERGWPARPGQSQHSWEHPRLESRMGFTANGYDFTEDLLRMAGNAVVEQTAELAFLTLLQKHRLT
jgi:DNA (cytosine-5)-methyltransferase 1